MGETMSSTSTSSDDSSDDDEISSCFSAEHDAYDPVIVDYINRQKLDGLKRLREEVDWESKKERARVFWQIYFLISDWNRPRCPNNTPNLRDVFQPAEIERLLVDAVKDRFRDKAHCPGNRFIRFVARSGYKDERPAELPSSRRTTPLHHEAKRESADKKNIVELFKIYDGYDVNYVDEESGLTHFHVACKFGLLEVVRKFLEHGQDANCLPRVAGVAASIDPPLILAVNNYEMAELLLKHGADPNAVSAEGLTPLLTCCKNISYMGTYHFAEMLLDVDDERYPPVRIDARDKSGRTSLHLTLLYHDIIISELLLNRGADPNLPVTEDGSTPLHIICKRDVDDNGGGDETENWLFNTFFLSCDERKLTVLIDAKDNEGWTPLERAVSNLLPQEVDELLDRGADVSNFVFPTEAHFDARFQWSYRKRLKNVKLRLASCTMIIIECLEKRGYEPKRADALTVAKLFTKYGLLEKSSSSPENRWHDDPNLAEKAKEIMIKVDDPSLSLYDLIQLRPEEAAKELTLMEYLEFALDYFDFDSLSDKEHMKVCMLQMCEKLSRGFFRAWAVECFMELTRYQLPIECCKIIFGDSLANRDLCNVCLAVTIE